MSNRKGVCEYQKPLYLWESELERGAYFDHLLDNYLNY
jgi:hypothetical protein